MGLVLKTFEFCFICISKLFETVDYFCSDQGIKLLKVMTVALDS